MLSLRLPWILALLCFLWRFFGLQALANSPLLVPESGDMWFYADWGLRVLGGEWTDGKAFYGLPGYPWLLAALFALGGYNPFIPGLLQILCDAALAGGIVVFVRRIGVPKEQPFLTDLAAVTASILWILFASASAFSIIMMPTIIVVAAYWALILWAAKPRPMPSWIIWLGLGAGIGVLALLVATIFIVLPLLAVRAWLSSREDRPFSFRRMRRACFAVVLLFVGVLAGCSPAWLHNYFVANDSVFLTAHSGLNLYVGNNAAATGYPKIPAGMSGDQEGMLLDSITFAERAAGRSLPRSEVSAFWAEKAKTWMADNRAQWFGLLGVKLINFWNAFEYDDLSIVQVFRDQRMILPGIGWGVLVIFAGAGVGALFASRNRAAGWVIGGILLHMLSLIPVFVTERYRLAAVPGLAILAGIGLVILGWNLANRSWRQCVPALIGLVIGLFMTAGLTPPENVWSVGQFNAALANMRLGQMETAGPRLTASLARAPNSSEVIFSLGNYHRELDDSLLAARLYRKTLQLKPNHHRAANNLAVMLAAKERYAEALSLLEYAIKLDPRSPERFFLKAQITLELEDPHASLAAIEEALRLLPAAEQFQDFRQQLLAQYPELDSP